ncbi:PD-(D/E)XK nuclease family protein [Patescibacteria group bacterium]|nr:MAG: PD-(D/E)XK nuclease family protein [Patescibacteria group bacterium]
MQPEDLLSGLNPEQTAAVTHDRGPLLIVAGAGTGKTNVITRRIGWLMASGRATAEEILALTFTEKAAGEMEERVDRLLPLGYGDLWICTFHGFGERVLRERGLEIGLPRTFPVYDETAQAMLMRRKWEALALDYYKPLGNPTKFLQALVSHFSRVQDELVGPEEYLKHAQAAALDGDAATSEERTAEAKRLAEVAEAYHAYKRLLREEGALDFSDLINETLRLFKERPHILAEFRKRFRYILVDEFQDTNWAQYELVKLLTGEDRNVTVVGDDDQSIYKFRGASVSNILDFERDFGGVARVVLTRNYRSRQEILDCAYGFIQNNNPDRLEVTLGEGLSKRLVAERGSGGIIERLHGKTIGDEARLVIERIRSLKDADPDTSWNDFAVLVRANDHAEPFLHAMKARGIPHEFMGARGLYTAPIALDILAYLRLLIDPFDSPSCYRVLTTPVVSVQPRSAGLPHDALIALTHHADKKSMSLFEACRRAESVPGVDADSLTALRRFTGLIDRHGFDARRAPIGTVLLAMLHESGYLKALANQSEEMSREAMRVLQQFWKDIERFAAEEAEPTTARFLAHVRMQLETGDSGFLPADPEAGPELVRVMTAHAAKGLEFANVFIVNLVDRRFPTSERRDAIPVPEPFIKEHLPKGDAHLQEERRLFYVALTRARDRLFLTSADDYGGSRAKKPSRFLGEAGFGPVAAESREPVVEVTPQARPAFGALKLPERMSFTQFAAFEKCPLQYKYEHLLRIPKRGNENQSFGQSVHGTLQEAFERYRARTSASTPTLFDQAPAAVKKPFGEIVSTEELLETYRERFVDEWYASAEARTKRYETGRKALMSYAKRIAEQTFELAGIEVGFTLKFGETVVKGRIDRIDRLPDGTVQIIDYKTGKAKEDPDRDQLLIYQLAALRVLNLKPSKLTYHYLEGDSEFTFLGTNEELSECEGRIEGLIGKMRTSDFHPTPGPQVCKFCDFREICESRAV